MDKINKPIPWNMRDLIAATQGDVLFGASHIDFESIKIDSRTTESRDIFLAIKGENHDAHKFVPHLIKQGVKGFLIEGKQYGQLKATAQIPKDVLIIGVPDSIGALGDLALFQRNRSHTKLAAITGSNGKTTTKEMTYSLLNTKFNTLKNKGNFNNEIGMPLSLLKLSNEHERIVLELGMNNFGEISRLGKICQPEIAAITNVAPAHLEGVNNLDGVLKAKSEIISTVEHNGTVILNKDDPKLCTLTPQIDKHKLIWVGCDQSAHINASMIEENEKGILFTLNLYKEKIKVQLQVHGKFFIINALIASAIGIEMGLSPDQIQTGLAQFSSVKGRMNVITNSREIKIIDDTYNANPGSVRAALCALKDFKKASRGVLVIGDMHELGDDKEILHREVGKNAAQLGLSLICATGENAQHTINGVRENISTKETEFFIGSKDQIISYLNQYLQAGDWVLIKGSRLSKMEDVVLGLTVK